MREICACEKMVCNPLASVVGGGWASGVCNCSIFASDLFLIPSNGREFSSPPQEAPLDCSNHLGISLSDHVCRVVSRFLLYHWGGLYWNKCKLQGSGVASFPGGGVLTKSQLVCGRGNFRTWGVPWLHPPISGFWLELWEECRLLVWKGCAILYVVCDLGDTCRF